MFDSVGWPELLVLALIGLFVLGPERLPAAIKWVADTMRTVRDYATGAREQLRSELGSELDEFREPLENLRSIRGMNPKTAVRRALLEPADGTWSGAATPAVVDAGTSRAATRGATNGAATNGSASNGASANGATATGAGVPAAGAGGVVKGQSDRATPLASGEQAPFDPDAT